jgi:hypothetical protein
LPEIALALESLSNERQGIELLSVKQLPDRTLANVFVPDGRLDHFERYVTEYLEEHRTLSGQVRDHKALLNTIAEIRKAEIRALWMDDVELLPQDPSEQFWWEVWLPVRNNRDLVLHDFRRIASLAECRVGSRVVNFPERTVVQMHGSEAQFSRASNLMNCVAELRRAKETAAFFLSQGVDGHLQASAALEGRTTYPRDGDDVPHVCILDSGVTRGHPLIRDALGRADLHTINQAWGVDDAVNHGTGMAGLALYGDLTDALQQAAPIAVRHRLESVKLLNQDGGNVGDDAHHAYLFAEGVSRPEIDFPRRKRIFTSAVTASDYRDRGRPSSWSAAVDSLASSPETAAEATRLFVISAGNTVDPAAWGNYPASLTTNLIHDPGQAWNALTVGAYTQKVIITDDDADDFTPVASHGSLSPRTTTSATWDQVWPLKPDVVMEGGNVGADKLGAIGLSSLDLLTTTNTPTGPLFCSTNGTSAASAQCAKLAAEISAAVPGLRSETIRALVVHSAEWTPQMRADFLGAKPHSKVKYRNLIRHCGWGVPSAARAVWSATNSLTLIVEDRLFPYGKEPGEGVKTRDMHLHRIPWPKDELEKLQNAKARMQVTLSYFVEPNPSARGAISRYHYPSFRLRFDVRRPLESTRAFMARVNAAAASADDDDVTSAPDPDWLLGSSFRHRGSLHQDVWEGTAADLASRGFIAVYPAMGWWRTRPALQRFDLPARYSLIVSIETPDVEVDLYTPIANQVGVPIEVQT